MALRRASWRHIVGLASIAAVSLPYVFRLDSIPALLFSDEANFATNALSIASTGRDLNGNLFPLFFLITDPLASTGSSAIWYQPFIFYALAIVLTVFPIAEWSIRLAPAMVAILNIWLAYVIARRLFQRRFYALLAALMLGATPAHFIMGRRVSDVIFPLPFALVWFWGVLAFRDSGRLRYMAAAGLALGIGFFTHIGSWGWMPLFLAVTAVAIRHTPGARQGMLTMAFAFVVPLLSVGPLLWSHPESLQDLGRYTVLAGRDAGRTVQPPAWDDYDIARHVAIYWDYFNPSFLFFAGGANPTQTTSQTGIFLLPMAAFLAAGMVYLFRRRWSTDMGLVLAFLAVPLPVAIRLPDNPEYTVARVMLLLPFGALIAAHGLEFLLTRPRRWVRTATCLLLLAMPLQYAYFLKDFFTDYQVRSARRSDPLNFVGVAEFLLARDSIEPIPALYFAENLPHVSWLWKFFTVKAGRPVLWTRTKYFDPARVSLEPIAPQSLLVFTSTDPAARTLLDRGGYSVATVIVHLDGEAAATILTRNP